MSDWITLATGDGPMNVFVARPVRPNARAIVVLQEAFGVNANIQDICRRLAGEGYLALAPDLFHRSATGALPYGQHAQAVALIGSIDADAILGDVRATLAHLAAHEGLAAGATALLGFCFGGRAAFTAATRGLDLGAAVVFYGPGVAAGPHAQLDQVRGITAPLLLHVGEQDPTIPAEHVAATAKALADAGVVHAQHVYAGAGHAFACEARPAMFRPDAAALAWQRTFLFLRLHLAPAA